MCIWLDGVGVLWTGLCVTRVHEIEEVSQAGRSSVHVVRGVLVVETSPQLVHSNAGGMVVRDASACASPGVKDGGLVAPAEISADRRKRLAGELAGKVHGHLSWPGNTWSARGGEELLTGEAEVLACGSVDLADGPGVSVSGWRWVQIETVEHLSGQLTREGTPGE